MSRTEYGIILPEDQQRRPAKGRLKAWGPGKLIKKGELAGERMVVSDILGMSNRILSMCNGPIVGWSDKVEAWEIGRDRVECVIVRAQDLDYIED